MYNVRDNTIIPTSVGRRGRSDIPYSVGAIDDAIIYPSKMDCIETLIRGLDKYITTRLAIYDQSVNYASDYNSWVMASGFMYTADTSKNWAKTGLRESYFERSKTLRWNTCEGLIETCVQQGEVSAKLANNKACWAMFQKIREMVTPRVQMSNDTTESNQDQWTELEEKWEWALWYFSEKRKGWKQDFLPRVQMETPDKTTEQGDTTQESDKQVNTIITRDQQEAVSNHHQALDTMGGLSSSEEPHRFPTITGRWMPLDAIEISTSDKQSRLIKTYYLPEGLYQDKCTPNLNPFETFIYGRMDVELRLVVNGNKFCCGKLVMSGKYDSYQADAIQDSLQSALNRNHVIVDVSTNNEGVLQIPFRYHRPYVRLVHNDAASLGVRPSKCASVYIHVLSPITTGKDGPSEINARVFFRLKNSTFTGMSYRVPVVQMFGVEQLVTPTTARALKEVLVGAERAFDQIGRSQNQDKPSNISAVTIVPHPKLNFASGKGITDVLTMRVNPHTLTNYAHISVPQDEPKSYYDLARIWGIYKEIKWSNTNTEGQEIASLVVDPTARSYTADFDGALTPLEYACGNFAFWTGTIEYRLDFVSNAFHTGTVQISAEFGRTTATTNMCESSSTYVKVFHLGDQKSVTFRVPYIYDTIMRRSTAGFYNPYEAITTTDVVKDRSLTVAPLSNTRLKIRVVNVLRPPASAPQEIAILLFMRAGKNFRMHGLKAVSTVATNPQVMDEFPCEYNRTSTTPKIAAVPAARARRDIPGNKLNRWGEYKPEWLPQTQMDNGEKEDQDNTADFNQGGATLDLLTLDNQMNFKDLLRRPTLILWDQKVIKGYTGSFMIPCQPPSRQMCRTASGINSYWASTLGQTTAVNIMDMFRAWRGSMRYTIVVTQGSKPFYISYVPHSGTRLLGQHEFLETNTPIDYPMSGANFMTEMIVPSVNPVMTIEVPYDTENTWTLTYDEDVRKNYSWRDKGDYNSGHIAFNTHEELKIDVWWSAGDDFEIANFYGVPATKWNGWAYRWDDKFAKVQMDFQIEETLTTVNCLPQVQMERLVELGKKTFTSKMAMRTAMGAIPFVGTPLILADVGTAVEERVDQITDRAVNTLEAVSTTANKMGIATEQLSQLLMDTVNKVTGTITGLVQGATILYDVILDILMAWMEQSWKLVGIGLVRFITKVMVVPSQILNLVMGFSNDFSNFISTLFTNQTAQVQSDVNHSVVYVGLLAGLIGTITGVALDPSRWYTSFSSALLQRLTHVTGVAYLVHVLNFVRMTFDTIKDMLMSALGYISPEARALKLLGENNQIIEKFVREAQIITSESNTSLLNQPSYRRRFWYCVLQAHQLQRVMCQVPTNCVSFQLSKLCTDVIKSGNEKFLDLSASPVRFEPMVICMTGAAGVGKSHVTEALVDKLLGAINYTGRTSEKVFYRTAGEKFWSGYRDQPVVIYDEWLNTNDSTRCIDQIAEMMKLKSTALFIPEMAHLEEKRIKGNPLIIIICCNDAFPNALSNYATCPPAVLRRRDIVLHVTRKEEYEGVNLRTLNGDEQVKVKEYDHLKFQIYKDVTKRSSLTKIYKDYATTSHWLTAEWVTYYKQELEQVKVRMARLPQYMDAIEDGWKIQDPFTLFYHLGAQVDRDISTNMNGYTHYEALETAMQLVSDAINNEPIVENEIPSIECVPWALAQRPEPRTQLFTDMTVGALIYGWLPNIIAKASMSQLLRWEGEINPLRSVEGRCIVCFEEQARCAYVCSQTYNLEGEARHIVCAECYIGINHHTEGHCPMCRCEQVIPIFNQQDLSTLAVWARLKLYGIKSMKWLCEKVTQYYNWRRDHPCIGLMVEWLMELAYMFTLVYTGTSIPDATTSVINVSRVLSAQRYVWIGTTLYSLWGDLSNLWNVHTQMDEEDDWNVTRTPPVVVEQDSDEFEIPININIIKQYLELPQESGTAPCLHHKIQRHIRSATLIGSKWRIADSETRQMIDIDARCCGPSCKLFFDNDGGGESSSGYSDAIDPVKNYIQIFTQYATHHKAQLRQYLIQYYNNPSLENRVVTPEVYRPSWMDPVEVPMRQSWWEYLSEQWTNYRQIILYCGAAVAVVVGICGAYQLASALTTGIAITSQISATAGSPEASQRNPRRTLTRQGRNRPVYFHSETETPTIYEVACRYIIQNTFHLEIEIGTTRKVMYGTGLFNHYLLIPRHYVKEIRKLVKEEGHRLYGHPVVSPQLRAEIILDWKRVVVSEETDLAYMCVPPKFPLFKDIRKFLASDGDLESQITSEGILLLNPKGAGPEIMREHVVDIEGYLPSLPVLDQDNNRFIVKDVICYTYSKPGVCGSILLRENHQRPILSMHFAGDPNSNGMGYGIPITQEALCKLCEIKDVPVQFDDQTYGAIEDAKFVYETGVHLAYYGSVGKELVPYTPTKSKLEPSLISGKNELHTIMEPAVLSKNDPRYIHVETPLYAGVRKHGIITRDFDPGIVDMAGEQLWDGWISQLKPLVADPKELTMSECIVGIAGFQYYTPMDLMTSAGYPFNLNKQRTQKQHYITVVRDEQLRPISVDYIDPTLEEIIDMKRELRKQGIVPHTLFCDTLKDEKRKHDKVMQLGGTRVFCSSPVDYVIECRRYFMHFVATFMANRHDIMSAVGINPTSDEWGQLLGRLMLKNGKVGTIDYSNFGPGYNASVARKAYDLIVRWTMEHVHTISGGQLDKRELECIVYECLQSMHVCNNTVYQQGAGSPSGAFFTTIINTMVNILYLLIAWNILLRKNRDINKELIFAGPEFKKHVTLYCYGDDGIFSVTPEYEEMYNMQTITELFAEYGIVATDATKSTSVKKWEKLSEAQFLKRGFIPHPTREGKWLSPLAWESVVSCTQWVWVSENKKEATYVNAQAAVMEAHGHGPDVFNAFKQQVNKALRKEKIKQIPATWGEYDDIFYTIGFENTIDQLILRNM